MFSHKALLHAIRPKVYDTFQDGKLNIKKPLTFVKGFLIS